jgi:hypothetical protein
MPPELGVTPVPPELGVTPVPPDVGVTPKPPLVNAGLNVLNPIVEPKRKTALVGAIVLEDFDLLVDCKAQQVVPRDPRGAIHEVE